MFAARCEADVDGLRDADYMTGANEIATDMVPAAQLRDGNAEAVGDGNERVTTADTIERCASRRIARRGGNDDAIDSAEISC